MTMLNLLYVFKKLCYPSIIISITIRGARQVAPAAVIEVRNMESETTSKYVIIIIIKMIMCIVCGGRGR